MNPFKLITRPFKDVADAITMPFKAIFVVGLCAVINYMTSPGHWWVQWVALGMGIAVLVAWARAAKTIALLALIAWVGYKIYQRYGADARAKYDAWVAKTSPQAKDVMDVFNAGAARINALDVKPSGGASVH
jgi:hypothetical protein